MSLEGIVKVRSWCLPCAHYRLVWCLSATDSIEYMVTPEYIPPSLCIKHSRMEAA